MADYSLWVLGESQISLSGGAILDGGAQHDGGHLVGEVLTLNSTVGDLVNVSDGGNNDTNFSDDDGNQTLNGAQTIDGVTYADGTRIEAEYRLIVEDPNTGTQYEVLGVNIRNSMPASATVEALAFVGALPPAGVALEIVSSQDGPSNTGGDIVEVGSIVPLCFARGTRIETLSGPRPVEELTPGDVVITEGGAAPLRRVFHTRLTESDLAARPKLRPVRIMAGAMGPGLPQRDLLVSRQHRMLVSSRITERMFGARDVLVAAIKLTALPGIYVDEEVAPVEYYHLLFDRHQVVLAEGTPSESLFTGPEALKAVSPEARAEILELFPDLAAVTEAPEPVCPIPVGRQQRQLISRHAKNNRPLLGDLW